MPTAFDSLYTEFVISSFDKQLHLADAHGEDDWSFNMTDGQITFGDSVSYRIEILGTEDHVGETWMWGWANKASEIPDRLLCAVNELRSFGDEHDIRELIEAKLPLEEIDGHTVGLVAAGFAKGKAYYRCPYKNGALFVLITDDQLEFFVADQLVRALVIIPQAISALEIRDHRAAIAAYLRQQGIEVMEDGGNLVVQGEREPLLTAEFDELKRLTRLKSHLKPNT
jgi:hypothetical protein